MTVDITLKPEGTGGQTIFDFGSSTDNCLVLKIASDGKPELVATVGGKEVLKLTSTKALAAGEWASVRVEIDGKKSSLWVDGEKTGETATSFRASDVFPGGQVKRNFIAATRDGTGRFTGVMDQVVVLPEQQRVQPRGHRAEIGVCRDIRSFPGVTADSKVCSPLKHSFRQPHGRRGREEDGMEVR